MEGNQMKMREALVEARQIVAYAAHRRFGFMRAHNGSTKVIIASETLEKVDAALSAPARNCDQIDLPNDCNCKTIHLSDRVHMLNTDSRGDHEWDDEVCSLEFVGKSGGDEWLVHGCEGAAWACECEVLAPAAEKGENDGSK